MGDSGVCLEQMVELSGLVELTMVDLISADFNFNLSMWVKTNFKGSNSVVVI